MLLIFLVVDQDIRFSYSAVILCIELLRQGQVSAIELHFHDLLDISVRALGFFQ